MPTAQPRMKSKYRDEVVPAMRLPHRAAQILQILGLKIRDQEGNRPALGDAVDEVERVRHVCAASLRLEHQDFAHDAQDMLATFLRWDVLLDAVGEQDQTHFIAVANRRERQHARQLSGQFALALPGRTEVAGGAEVHHQQDRQLAFLGELLDERPTGASGDVPVNRAHFVAGHVLAHFVEVHAAAAEDRVILAGQRIVDEPAGPDLDLANFLQNVAGLDRVHGTGKVSRISLTMSSDVTSSASAS